MQGTGLWIFQRGGSGLALSLFLLCALVAEAQLTTGTLTGSVSDPSGAAVPGATVTVKNVDTGVSRTTTTGPTGRYEAPNLPVGSYEVSASATGFQTSVRAGIELTVGRIAVVDHALQVGEVTQQVTVTGEAPLLETTTATIANLVDAKKVEDLPLNNRDLTQLSFLQPGVLKIPRTGNFNVFGGMGDTLSVAGARSNQNVYLLDGVTNSDLSGNAQGASGAYSGAETVKEFQVITNNYSAEYRSQAGAIISAVTKSGTNSLHGSAFEFLRNDKLDAANFFDNASGNPKPEFQRNQFGGALGGPVVRDKTFFFGSYEGTRERLGTTDIARVLSAPARLGMLPGRALVTVSPLIRPYLDLWPVPGQGNAIVEDFGDGTARIAGTQRRPINDDYMVARIDHQFAGPKAGFLSGTYNFDDSDRNSFGILGDVTEGDHGGNGAVSRKHVAAIRHTSVFSPIVLNEFDFGYSGIENAGDIPLSKRNFGNLVFRPDRALVGQLTVPGLLDSVGFRVNGQGYHQKSFTARDGLSITRGNHSFRLGGEINWLRYDQANCPRGCNGIYEFRSLSDLLTATPRRLDILLPESDNPVRNLRQLFFGSYFQDNWQLRPSFTLNLGLRYEFATVPAEDNNLVSALVNFFDSYVSVPTSIASKYPIQAPLFVGNVDPYFTNPTLKSFSPRFGFAWAPGSKKTSLRGGFGIFYEHPMLYQLRTSLQELPPYSVVGRIDSSVSNPLRFPDAYTTQQSLLRARPNIRTLEYNMKTTYMYRWSLTLQREFGNEWMVSAGYTGSRALHLLQQSLPNINRWEGWPNQPTGRKFFPPNSRLINPNFGEMRVQAPNGNSYYHGLALSAQKRLSHGVQFQLSYNFSHAIDQSSGVTQGGEELPQGQRGIYYWDLHLKRGPAAFDIKHNFVANFSYEPTFGRGLTGAAGMLGKGWQFNGILSLISGHPLSVLDSNNAEQITRIGDVEGLRANLIPGGNNNPVLGGPDKYYDPTQFTPSELGYFGTTGPGTVRSPGLATFDLSIFKNFNVTESNRFQFRAEFFNLFNRVNLHTPDMDPYGPGGALNPNAGKIDRTRTSARQIQFALKYIF